MLNISAYLQNRTLPEVTEKDERKFLLKEIYKLYSSDAERLLRKIKNWKNYCAYLRVVKSPDTKEQQNIFKSSKKFIKEIPENRMWFFVSHVKTKDLYSVKSQMEDRINRGSSASAWFISLCTGKKLDNK